MSTRLKGISVDGGAMIGAVRLRGQWRLFAGFVADWIMDYYSYDPTSNPEHPQYQESLDHDRRALEIYKASPYWTPDEDEDDEFRGGLYQVNEANADEFCRAMERWEVSPTELRQWLLTLDEDEQWKGELKVAINFDNKVFVNGFSEQSIELYVPSGWTGLEDNPLKYVSSEMRSWWIACGYLL